MVNMALAGITPLVCDGVRSQKLKHKAITLDNTKERNEHN